MSSLDLARIFKTRYASSSNLLEPGIPAAAYETAMKDSHVRISPEFHVPTGMKDAVSFWLHIYTEYTTHHVVIFDERHPSIVYEVLDFRDLDKTARNRVVYEILRKRKIDKTLKAYKVAFARLKKTHGRKPPKTPQEKNILAATKRLKEHQHGFAEMARNLRTQTGQRDNIMKGLLAAEAYFPKMEQIFTGIGVPKELTRLSLVESSFNLEAISRVGATGVWQFMPKSGREYMLVDEAGRVDERISPLKSTVAAAKLLKRNRRILGNWPLAVTSYNHGLRGLVKVPTAHKSHDKISKVFDPCTRQSKLGWASRNYYAEYLAVLHAEAYREVFYGEPPFVAIKAISFHRLPKSQTALDFIMERGIALKEFHALNPDVLNINVLLPKGFVVVGSGGKEDVAVLLKSQKASLKHTDVATTRRNGKRDFRG